MKVCKVVVNSVSHDARVLKEAEAIREAGFDVVIVGIQDANNSIPIQILENAIVIRRAAWQSIAFQPPGWLYLFKFALLAASVAGAVYLLLWLKQNYPLIAALVTLESTAVIISIAIGGYFTSLLWTDYRRRKRSFDNLSKREDDDLLKYEADLSAHRAKAGTAVSTGSRALAKEKDQSPRLVTQLPRPLMNGLISALAPANIRRWKAVFARERRIYQLIEEECPDIVHAHDLSALPLATKYAMKHNARLVFDAHEIYDHLAQSEDEMSELNGKILRKYSGEVDLFITINDSIARYYQLTYNSLPRAVVIKNATKTVEPFTYDGRLHHAANLTPETRILIYQGGFAPKRGLVQLILSAEYLDANWSLVFMGWGRLEEELRRIADSLKMKNPELDSRIRFVPRVKQPELPYWTAGASLGAIPYENTGLNHWYCSPNKLWEYPNAGVPIIASPFPELRNIIESHQIGWLLPDPLTPRAIAAAVNGIGNEDLQSAARNCQHFIRSDNWDVYAERLKNAYARIR